MTSDLPTSPQSVSRLARIALICGIATPLSMLASRWLVSRASYLPGDDTFFLFMMAAPALAAIGLVLSLIARSRESNGVVTAALMLNGVWLALFVFGIVNFAATFEGK